MAFLRMARHTDKSIASWPGKKLLFYIIRWDIRAYFNPDLNPGNHTKS